MAETFLVNLNELGKKDTMDSMGIIKGLISDKKMIINNKGINQYEIDSHHRFLGTTNGEDPILTKNGDRRNLVIRCSDEKKGDAEYFANLRELMEDVNVVKTCYEYFKNLDGLKDFGKIPVPFTEYQKNIQEANRDLIELWLEDFTRENYDDNEVELLGKEQYTYFGAWCKTKGLENHLTAIQFGKKLKNLKIPGVERGRHTKSGETNYIKIRELASHFKLGCLINLE